MTIDEVEEIISYYEYWEDFSCSCHCGNPPCSKCVEQPSKEDYNQALKIYEEYFKINRQNP